LAGGSVGGGGGGVVDGGGVVVVVGGSVPAARSSGMRVDVEPQAAHKTTAMRAAT